MIEAATFGFLRELTANNHREWFHAHKAEFEAAKANFLTLVEEVLAGIKVIEPRFYDTQAKDCLFRIYRDVRFSKDKKPYKTHLAAAFGEGGKNSGKIDYYFHLQDGESFLGGGIWQPTAEQLAKLRQEIDYAPEGLKSIIEAENFRKHFPILHGDKLVRPPKGYTEDHPDIALLKQKEMFFMKKFTNQEVMSKDFAEKLLSHMAVLKPFVDYTNELFYGE
jgi:uncharacterized protein (TIGR02453 family)